MRALRQYGEVKMQHAITRFRVPLVLLMAVGLVLGSLAAPAAATEGVGEDIDSVRAQTCLLYTSDAADDSSVV